MASQFKREVELTIGPVQIAGVNGFEGLGVEFDITRSITIEPNTAEIAITNLSETTRNKIPQLSDFVNRLGKTTIPAFRRGAPIELNAGYSGDLTRIFKGNLRQAVTVRQGADTVLKLSAGDFEGESRSARVNKSFRKGTTLVQAASEILKTMADLGPGNLIQSLSGLSLDGGRSFTRGTAMSGSSLSQLSALVDAAGGELSIQNGVAQVLPKGKALSRVATRLVAGSGLLGTPTVDNIGVLKARASIRGGLEPGRLAELEGEFVTGRFRIVKVNYKGGTRINDFFAEVTGWASS